MKKYGILIAGLLVSCLILCACTFKPAKQSAINYQRRLKQYLPAESTSQPTRTIDLSEGPKLKYDANLGPHDVNFDFKIKNPY